MLCSIFTLFPEFFETPFQSSMLKRAQAANKVTYEIINIRDFSSDKHHVTDDRPFGGGPGMVMMVEPIDHALQDWRRKIAGMSKNLDIGEKLNAKVVLTSAKGTKFTQSTARAYAELDALAIICGHYEGVDERVVEHLIDEEVRIGDFVLTGGEPAALVIADAVTRLLPGVLGNETSTVDESHAVEGRLGFPQYTRPSEYNGWNVPEVLLRGHHAEIEKWRAENRNK